MKLSRMKSEAVEGKLLLLLALIVGCAPLPELTKADLEKVGASKQPVRPLKDQLKELVEQQFRGRELSLEQHAAWQIMHGFLAYRTPFEVSQSGKRIRIFDHLMSGGEMKGWELFLGDKVTKTGRRGVKTRLSPGDFVGQGHIDQWIAILAQADIDINQTVMVQGQPLTLEDWVRQSQWDVSDNATGEYSWTLIALTHYLPKERSWIAKDGSTWTWEDLVEFELAQDLSNSACGGSHRMEALALALQTHIRLGGKLDGVWLQVQQRIDQEIDKARRWQNFDGTLSSQFLARPGASSDLGQTISSTGHIFEFIAMAGSDDLLKQPWVEKTASRLAEAIHAGRNVDLECGGLYHSLHGLIVYYERRWGKSGDFWNEPAR